VQFDRLLALIVVAVVSIVGIMTHFSTHASGPTSLDLWHAPQALDSMANDADPVVRKLAAVPASAWVGDWDKDPKATVQGYVNSAAGKTAVLVLYGFPRDGYSAGGFTNRQAYLSWLQAAVDGAGSAPVWWIVEPDALGLLPADPAARAEQLQTLSMAMDILSSKTTFKKYIEASTWIDSTELANRLVSANIAQADGFAMNVSGFNSTPDMYVKGNEIISELATRGVTGKKYVIDSSRNGNGPLTASTPHADDWLSRGLSWLNPPARGAGLSPRVPGDNPNCAALLWIKGVGASDGNDPGSSWMSAYYSTPAPGAGQLWPEWVRDFAAHTTVANLAIPAATAAPTPTPALQGDTNNDARVNIFDLSALLSGWGSTAANLDFNLDGTVSIFDLSILLSHWTG
jgi:endoglucanase